MPATHLEALATMERLSALDRASGAPPVVRRISLAGDEDDCLPELARVVKEAAALGLLVYDDYNGMCFLPDGRVLPADMQAGWEADLAELAAGPDDPSQKKPDGRTLLERIAGELFDAIGRGNRHNQ